MTSKQIKNEIIKSQKQKKEKCKKIDCNKLLFIVCRSGIKINLKELKQINPILYKKLTTFFIIKTKSLTGYINIIKAYHTRNAYMVFPRFGLLTYLKSNTINYYIKNILKGGCSPSIPYKWTGLYTNNQALIETHILDNYYSHTSLKHGNSGLILNLEAGQGKTYLSVGMLQKIQKKALIICPTKNIMYQWIKVLKDGYPQNTIAHYYGEKKEYGDVVVGIINSLISDKLYINDIQVSIKDFFEPFGIVIFDEIHEYSSRLRCKIYNRVQTSYMLGLSATPDEKQFKMDNINTWNCGSILEADKIIGYSVEDAPFKGVVTKISYNGHPLYTSPPITESTGMICHATMINQICDDPYRVHIIIKLISDLRKKAKFIFVFADRRKYLTKIKEELDLFDFKYYELFDENDILVVNQLMGGNTSDDIEYAKKNSNIILTTYQYMGTGCSIPKMDAIILTTPKKKKSKQYINRIFRLGSNYDSVREIIDIVDISTYLKSQWYSRKKYYNDKQYVINTEIVMWKDIETEMIEMGILCDDDDDYNDDDDTHTTVDELERILDMHRILC